MAQVRAEVLTPWSSVEDVEFGVVNVPLIAIEFSLSRFVDVTGQEQVPPNPNVTSALIECDETVLDNIATDDRFFVVWEEYV